MKRWAVITFSAIAIFLIIKFWLAVFSFSQKIYVEHKKLQTYKTYKSEKLTPPPDCEGIDPLHFRIGEHNLSFDTELAKMFLRTEDEDLVAKMKTQSCVGTFEHPILVRSIGLTRIEKVNSARREYGLSRLPIGISFIEMHQANQHMIEFYKHYGPRGCSQYSLNSCRRSRLLNDLNLSYSIAFLQRPYPNPSNEYEDRPAFGTAQEQDSLLDETEKFLRSLLSAPLE